MRLPLLALAFVLGAIFAPRAQAASCCGSILAQPDRLGPGERRALRLGLGGAYELGSFGSDARYRADGGDVLDADARLRIGASQRLTPSLQLWADTAWVQGFRRFGSEGSTAGTFGDVTLGARLDPPQFDRWAAFAAIGLPTGRTMSEAQDRLGADVTGRGAVIVRAGLLYERTMEEWFVLVGAIGGWSGPERGSGVDSQLGLEALGSIGYSFRNAAGISLSAQGAFRPERTRDGTPLAESAERRVTLSLAGGWPLDARTSISAALALDPPVGGAGRNTPVQLAASLGLRWLFFGE